MFHVPCCETIPDQEREVENILYRLLKRLGIDHEAEVVDSALFWVGILD